MRSRTISWALGLTLCTVLVFPGLAHEPLDAATAQSLLSRIDDLNATLAAGAPPAQEAEALYALGQTVRRIVENLNGDLVTHGELGLVSSVLPNELERRGIALRFSESANRYRRHLEPFARAAALAPDGANHADALFRVLKGGFYDSFTTNPFQLVELDWPGLVAQIEDAEALLARYPKHAEHEEILFILGVDCARAARLAPDAGTGARYAARARAVLTDFREVYPQSLRAITARTLLKRLPKEG